MTAAVRPTVLTGTVETHTPLVNDREPVGLARGREPAGLVRQTRLGTVASDRILLPVRLADAARTARPRGRPAADPGKDHRHAKEGVTAHRGPPEAATAAGRKGLAEAATAAGRKGLAAAARRNGRLAGGQGAVPGFRRLVAR
jgi:hypothetical protein